MTKEVPLSIWTMAVCGEDDGGVLPVKAADVPKFRSDKDVKCVDTRLPLNVKVNDPICEAEDFGKRVVPPYH